MRTRVSRRAFLRFSSAMAGAFAARLPRPVTILSALPLNLPHRHIPETAELLRRAPEFDAVLVPAYAAAELIRAEAVRPLPGPPGRAHDPEGAFTLPHATLVAGLVYRGAPPPTPSLDDLWSSHALWPADMRLVIGAALLRRGYPLNDSHPGHLAQVESDLRRLRPRLTPNPLRALEAGRGVVALALLNTNDIGSAHHIIEGGFLLEYDWVIPRITLEAKSAEQFIRAISRQPSAINSSLPPAACHLPTFCPLPAPARARYAELWANVQQASL